MSEKKIYRYGDMLHMPRGIEMKGYYHGDGSITYIGQYLQPNARPKRVYRIEVISNAVGFPGEWCADVIEDQDLLVKISGFSKWQVACGALGVGGERPPRFDAGLAHEGRYPQHGLCGGTGGGDGGQGGRTAVCA